MAIERAVNTPYSDAGGPEGDTADINLGTEQGTVTLSYETFTIPDRLQLQYEGNVIFDSDFVGTQGLRTVKVPFSGNSEEVTSVLTANLDDPDTLWEYTVDADGCADTTPLNIEVVGGEFEDTDGDGDCDAQGTILIGRTDGISQMLRVEGATAEYDDKSLKVTGGTVFSEIGNVAEPLFRGNFEIPFGTAVTSSLQETGGLPNEFKLAGLDIDFNTLALNRDGIGLGSRFKLPDDIGGIVLDSVSPGLDALFIRQDGISLGASGKISLPNPPKFPFFGLFDVEASNLSLEYRAPEKALKLQGKFALDSFVKETPVTKVVADLSGQNFVEIKDGIPDIKGSLTIETDLKTAKGWGLSEVKLEVDTRSKDVGGSAKVTFPFKARIPEAEFGLGFKLPIPPLELNRVSVNVDNLNLPIPQYPFVFFQRFAGAIENFAPSDRDPIEFSGGIGATLGPQVNVPALGRLALIRSDLDGKISSEQLSATGKTTIISDTIARNQGSATLNWNKKFFETKGQFTILDGLIQTNSGFKADSNFNINMAGNAIVGIPNFIPLFGGAQLGSGNFLLNFSNDSNLSNDFAAGWGTLNIQKFGLEVSLVLGVKGYFDGRFERIGARNIPATGSFEVENGTEYVLLGADWENEVASGAPIEIETPDGRIITEAEFAANNIAIVDELTDSTTKVAIVFNPTPGIWDIQLADTTGLGEVQYTAARDSAAPTIEVTSPALDVSGGQVAINYNAFDADSEAEIALFYDTDNEGFDGVLIADGLQETDGAGSFVWNTEGVPTGDYFIYAMVMDENNPPAFSYSPGRVRVTEEADLSVTKTASADPATVGNNLTYTIAVTNNGAVESRGITLTDTLPEGVTLVSSSIPPATQSDDTLTFDLGNLASGQNATIDITVAPTTEGLITNTASVTSRTFDPDATNDVDILTTTVDAIPVEQTDLSVSRTDSPDPVNLGENFTYTLAVANNSTTPATDVTLAESLPSGVNLVSATASRGTTSSVAGGLSANFGTLGSGEIATVDITVNPIAAGNLVSTTSVASNEPDANTANNFLIQNQTVNPAEIAPADLELTKTVDNPSPGTGDLVNFTLTLTNKGPGVASGIQVTDLLPPELTFVSNTSNQGSYDPSTGVWDAGNLRDGLSTPLIITAAVNSGGSITTTAEITATGQADPDSTPGNNNPAEDDQASVSLDGSGGSREFKDIFGIGDPPIVI